jgi:hypothetical protein
MVNIFKDKILTVFLSFSLIFLLVGLVLIIVNIDNLSSPLIVHINSYVGVDMMGNINHLWSLVLMGVLVFIINFGLTNVFFYRERTISYIITTVSFIVSLFVLMNIANIIALN